MSSPISPLSIVTRPSASSDSLFDWVSAEHPLAFVRDGEGIVGVGEVLRLEFHGASRFTDAARAWAEISRTAIIHDSVKRTGTGLVAFGSFAFAESSASTSVLIVPQFIVGSRDGLHWVTSITSRSAGGTATIADDVTQLPRTPRGTGAHVTFGPGDMTPQHFTRTVKAALRRIAAGDAAKVVVARDQVADLSPDADVRLPLEALSNRYPDTFTFAVDGLLGSSPETLVKVHHGTVSARVLAGSAARGDDRVSDGRAAAHLANSSKDQAEHALALASVIDALAPLSRELQAASEPFTLQLPNLWHLATDIEGQLTQASTSLDLLDVLHPTAAVAGTPTPAALRIINELEGFDRGRYAGPVGWVDAHGDGEWAVALRCAQIADGRITAYAGAGIVAGSNAKKELAETELKFRPIVEAFA